MSKKIWIFISSPGDVNDAREVAAHTVEKIAQEYARFFTIEPYLWEHEAKLASGHFQDSIRPPGKFDMVILILGSRLGTPLPPRFKGSDGRTPVTGTEWEFENALEAARETGIPDLLVYRSKQDVRINGLDIEARKKELEQLAALDVFWSRHFADHGTFIGAYSLFDSISEFAVSLERDLRKCVERRIVALTTASRGMREILWRHDPFRGLEGYEYEHAPIFFGRDQAVGNAMLRLRDRSEKGDAFLLVLGASGSGKSSLVKAGVLRKLFVRGRLTGSCILRRVVFRPSDVREGEDVFDALARRLTEQQSAEVGIPELLGPSLEVTDLARHLRDTHAHPAFLFAKTLAELGRVAVEKGEMLEYEKPKLVLVVDQLEELFTSEHISSTDRRKCIDLLAGLARSGQVLVIATMRSDFWYCATETPELVKLADGNGRIDLLPPSPAELSQMIKKPAEATGLQFETHAETGIPLNDAIAEEAAREPGALPLLSYLLDQLYREDILSQRKHVLSYATYERLGRLKGAIATRADAIIAAETPEVREALRHVLFALVQMGVGDNSSERPVARRAPLADFKIDTPERRLIEALLSPSARLLVADADVGDNATVRVAHEALITEWNVAKHYVLENSAALKTRRMLEERLARFQKYATDASKTATTGPEANNLANKISEGVVRAASPVRRWFTGTSGLLTGLELSDARRLKQDYSRALTPTLAGFIDRSVADNRRVYAARSALAVAGIAAIASSLTLWQMTKSEASLADYRAHSHDLAVQSVDALGHHDPEEALALALEALPHHGEPQLPEVSAALASALSEVWLQGAVVTSPLGKNLNYAAFSPHDDRIVTAGDDGTARVWNAETGAPVGNPMSHKKRVWSAIFSSDGTRIVTASADGLARIWDAATGTPLQKLERLDPGKNRDAREVNYAAFDGSGTRVVTANDDGTVRVWDATTGAQLSGPAPQGKPVSSAVFNCDDTRILIASSDHTARQFSKQTQWKQLGPELTHSLEVRRARYDVNCARIVTSTRDGTVRIWDANTNQPIGGIMQHDEGLHDAAFSPDGTRIVAAGMDQLAHLWDTASDKPVALRMKHDGSVLSAFFDNQSKRVLTASTDGTARIWDVVSNAQIGAPMQHQDTVRSAVFSANGSLVVTASYDHSAQLWNGFTGDRVGQPLVHGDRLWFAAFNKVGTRVVTGSDDNTARIWDAQTGEPVGSPLRHGDVVFSAAFSPDDERVATASWDATAAIWYATSGLPVLNAATHMPVVMRAKSVLERVAFSPDGQKLVTAAKNSTAQMWDATTGAPIGKAMTHSGKAIYSAVFDSTGHFVLTAGGDKTARLWSAETGEPILSASSGKAIVLNHGDEVERATFNSDATKIVTASADGTAQVWDAATGEHIGHAMKHTGTVYTAMFSSDGLRIVTASADHKVRIWDALTGAQIGEPMEHDRKVWSASFSNDGTRIVSASVDQTARLWRAAPSLPAPEMRVAIAELVAFKRVAQENTANPHAYVADLAASHEPRRDPHAAITRAKKEECDGITTVCEPNLPAALQDWAIADILFHNAGADASTDATYARARKVSLARYFARMQKPEAYRQLVRIWQAVQPYENY